MQWRDAGSQRRVERKQIPVDRINFESIYQLLLWIGQMIWHFLKLGIKAKSQSVKTWLCVRSIRMLINHFVYLCWAKNSRTHICTFTVYTHRWGSHLCNWPRWADKIKKGEVNTRRMEKKKNLVETIYPLNAIFSHWNRLYLAETWKSCCFGHRIGRPSCNEHGYGAAFVVHLFFFSRNSQCIY